MQLEITSEALAEQCKAGNTDAFAQIYRSFIDRIFNYIFYRTSRRETAEDLTSQTFLAVVEKIHTFKQTKGSFSAWIYRIAHNQVVDHLRTNHITEDLLSHWHLPSREDTENSFVEKEEQAQLHSVMEGLDKLKREIILLRIWDGLSYKEISQVIGKSEKNCKMIFSRALAKLRNDFSSAALLALIYLFPSLN